VNRVATDSAGLIAPVPAEWRAGGRLKLDEARQARAKPKDEESAFVVLIAASARRANGVARLIADRRHAYICGNRDSLAKRHRTLTGAGDSMQLTGITISRRSRRRARRNKRFYTDSSACGLVRRP